MFWDGLFWHPGFVLFSTGGTLISRYSCSLALISVPLFIQLVQIVLKV